MEQNAPSNNPAENTPPSQQPQGSPQEGPSSSQNTQAPPESPLPSPPPPPSGTVSQDDKNLGLLCHLLGFLTSFLGPLMMIANLVFCIMGCVAAGQGRAFRYPVSIRLIK